MFKNKNQLNNEDLKLFPDYEKFKFEIEKLNNYDFENLSPEEIYHIYYDFAKILPSSYRYMSKREFNKKTFYRVRLKKHINSIEDKSLIQTYSFPPASVCNNGRANLKGKSVFYCSDNLEGAIRESKPEIGDEGYLSMWKGITKRNIKIGICLPNDLPIENNWKPVERKANKLILNELPKDAKEKFKHIMELYNFTSEKFKTEKEPYHLTSMISNELLYGDLWNDFILYPSLMSKNIYCNQAFHPNSVNENLKFEKVLQFKIVDIQDEKIFFKLGKIGSINNTKIIYREKTNAEIKLINHLLSK